MNNALRRPEIPLQLNPNNPQDKQLIEIFCAAFKLGAIFGYNAAAQGKTKNR